MSSIQISHPPTLTESKSARKKKAKAEAAAAQTPVLAESETSKAAVSETGTNGQDAPSDSPYVKELHKNIRNIRKKLNATQKVDSIIAENPGVALDDLLAAKKINADQKAQAQKKPALQTQLAQFEEQVTQYQKFDEDYQKRLATEKTALETTHKEEIESVKEAAAAEARADGKKEAKENLLVLSKFLRAAAAKRQGGDETSSENRAFEGALLLVYGGEAGAVVAMESLIWGLEEKVPTVDATPSEYTYKQVRDLAFEYAPYAAEEAWAEDVAQSDPTDPTAPPADEPEQSIGTDPTLVHATPAEIEAQPETLTNGVSEHANIPSVPQASDIDAGAANESGGNDWEAKVMIQGGSGGGGGGGGEDWVQVPRDLAETDTGNEATTAAVISTQNWAEDIPTVTHPSSTPAYAQGPANGDPDGFKEVNHRGGRSRGGELRGGERRGGRGGYRGEREGGGRGRGGGFRGDRGGGEGGQRGRGRGGGGRARGSRGGGES